MPKQIDITVYSPRYRWVVLGWWLFCSVSSFMIAGTIGILLPSISSDLHISPGLQGVLSSAALWGNVVLAIPLSWWVSRYRPKLLSTITLLLGSLCLFLQGWAPGFTVLLIGRFGFGVTQIARQPARALLTQQWFPQREVILLNSFANALFGVIVGGGLIAAPFILSRLGGDWRTTFYLFGGFFSALTFMWMILGKERITPEYLTSERSKSINLLKGALSYRELWITGFGYIGANLAASAFLSFFPTAMLNDYGLSLQWSGIILALGVLVGGISGFWLGHIGITLNKGKAVLKIVGISLAVTYVGMILTGSIPTLLILSFINGAGWGFWPILFTVPFQLPGIRPREVAVALSFNMMMIAVGQALGPIIAGFLQEALGNLRIALFIASFCTISLTIAGTLLQFNTKEQTSTPQS